MVEKWLFVLGCSTASGERPGRDNFGGLRLTKVAWPYARPSSVHRNMHRLASARGHLDEDHCMPRYRGIFESIISEGSCENCGHGNDVVATAYLPPSPFFCFLFFFQEPFHGGWLK